MQGDTVLLLHCMVVHGDARWCAVVHGGWPPEQVSLYKPGGTLDAHYVQLRSSIQTAQYRWGHSCQWKDLTQIQISQKSVLHPSTVSIQKKIERDTFSKREGGGEVRPKSLHLINIFFDKLTKNQKKISKSFWNPSLIRTRFPGKGLMQVVLFGGHFLCHEIRFICNKTKIVAPHLRPQSKTVFFCVVFFVAFFFY